MAQPEGSRLIGRLQPQQPKSGRVRCTVAGKRVNFAGTSVISPDPSLPVGTIGIPLELAERLTVPVTITDLNMGHWQDKVDALVASVGKERKPTRQRTEAAIKRRIFRKGKPLMLVPGATLRVGDALERSLRNGDWVVPGRYPTLHKGGMVSALVKVNPDIKTVTLSPASCPGFGADFDGDTMGQWPHYDL